MGNIVAFFSEVRTELSKVVWPKREQVIRLTLIVIIISGIIAAYVGALDFIFTKMLTAIVSR